MLKNKISSKSLDKIKTAKKKKTLEVDVFIERATRRSKQSSCTSQWGTNLSINGMGTLICTLLGVKKEVSVCTNWHLFLRLESSAVFTLLY